MYGMILLFVLWGDGTPGNGSITHSQAITVYPDKASCDAALANAVQYQRGVEAGKGEKDDVGGFCIQVLPAKTVGT